MRELAFIGVFLGLVSSFFDFAYFALNRGDGIPAVRTLWFLFSVLTELALIYSIRTRGPMWKASRPGSILVLLTGLTALGALALTYSPFGHEVFQFISPTVPQLAGIGLLAAAYLVTTEIVKSIYAKIFQPSPQAV